MGEWRGGCVVWHGLCTWRVIRYKVCRGANFLGVDEFAPIESGINRSDVILIKKTEKH